MTEGADDILTGGILCIASPAAVGASHVGHVRSSSGRIGQTGKDSVPVTAATRDFALSTRVERPAHSVFRAWESHAAESGTPLAPRYVPRRAVGDPARARSREWVGMAKAKMPALMRMAERPSRTTGELSSVRGRATRRSARRYSCVSPRHAGATYSSPEAEGEEGSMKVVLVAGGRDYPSQGRVFEVLNEENPHLVMHCCRTGAETWASRWVVEHTRLELLCPADWGGYGEAAESRRNRKMLALLDTFSVAGDEVIVVALPDESDAAGLVHEARNWPFAAREIAA